MQRLYWVQVAGVDGLDWWITYSVSAQAALCDVRHWSKLAPVGVAQPVAANGNYDDMDHEIGLAADQYVRGLKYADSHDECLRLRIWYTYTVKAICDMYPPLVGRDGAAVRYDRE
jgi:hypothetical protein